MIVASGFVQLTESGNIETIADEMRRRGIEVNDTKEDKIIFLIERETVNETKSELDALRGVEGVKSVNLAYFSTEGADEGPDIEIEGMGNA
jgi:nitrate reductase NapAB chaperone NapD